MYERVWQYEVRPGRAEDFVAAYARDGDWARLFARGPGFAGTELYADVASPLRFLTVDRWASEAEWLAFRGEHAADYDALDRRLEGLCVDQRELIA